MLVRKSAGLPACFADVLVANLVTALASSIRLLRRQIFVFIAVSPSTSLLYLLRRIFVFAALPPS